MARAVTKDSSMDKRSESRGAPKAFHGASIKLVGVPLYQFKLKDTSENGASILVKEDSFMLNYLEVGQILNINFSSDLESDHNGDFETEIVHITKMEEGRYKGHYLVGVRILDKKNTS
jgi:PilZ domain-containing protein